MECLPGKTAQVFVPNVMAFCIFTDDLEFAIGVSFVTFAILHSDSKWRWWFLLFDFLDIFKT